jgi:hypothetical protein
MVMLSVCAVGVPMSDFFLSGFAHGVNFHIENQLLTR